MESFNQSGIKHKTELLKLPPELGNISNALGIIAFPETPLNIIRLHEMLAVLNLCLWAVSGAVLIPMAKCIALEGGRVA